LSDEEGAYRKNAPHTQFKRVPPANSPDDEEKRYVGNTHKGNIRHERETEDKKHRIGDKDNSRNEALIASTPKLPQRTI
jgi:hypothetical protein